MNRAPDTPPERRPFTDRIAARLAEPELRAAQRAPIAAGSELAELVGDWRYTVRIFATDHTPERSGQGTATARLAVGDGWLELRLQPAGQPGEEVAFLSYSPAAQLWQFVWLVTWRNTLTATAARWEAERLVLAAQPTQFYGEPVQLRITLTRDGPNRFSLVYAEAAVDGSWLPIDEYLFARTDS